MEELSTIKAQTLAATDRLDGLFKTASDLPGCSKSLIEEGRKVCQSIKAEMAREVARLAVVGPIKSGKSTFINCLLGADHLKRGAGVVTSIVTRIRRGRTLRAELFYKSIDEINADMGRALSFFPGLLPAGSSSGFDIRKPSDRAVLSEALAGLGADRLISNGAKDAQSLLLSLYLKGFDQVRAHLETGRGLVVFEGKDFFKHRQFTGDDALAVFLKDILLYMDGDRVDSDLEIADCQGSDSPNPFHLAMIQDYLLLAHFIIYVISSRTGLRRADIRFLSMIRNMGLLGQIIFVLNADLSEHEDAGGLLDLKQKVTEEIALIRPDPEVFCFSALYHLFAAAQDAVAQNDAGRLLLWQKQEDLTAFSQKEKQAFEAGLSHRLSQQRLSLLFSNHLERLQVSAEALSGAAALQKDMMDRDAADARKIKTGLESHQKQLNKVRDLAKTTLDGAVLEIQAELRRETDRLFDKGPEGVLGKTNAFIRSYKAAHAEYAPRFGESGFNRTIFRVYQDFKQALDGFIAETVTPEVIRFVMAMETRIQNRLQEQALAFEDLVSDALARYVRVLAHHGITGIAPENLPPFGSLNMGAVKSEAGIRLPTVSAVMRYTARMKTEAAFRFGFYKLVRKAVDLIKRRVSTAKTEEERALSDAVDIMRKNMLQAVAFSFKDFRENVKFQYLFKMADAAGANMLSRLGERFSAYGTDLSDTVFAVDRTRSEKIRIKEELENLVAGCGGIRADIARIKEIMADKNP